MLNFIKKALVIVSLAAVWPACNSTIENKTPSNVWVTVDSKGAITLLGKPVKDLESFQSALYDTLSKMPRLPDSIPVQFDQEILMGLRGDVREAIHTARETVAARPACEAAIHGFYAWYDQFAQNEANSIQFIDYSGKYLKINDKKLDDYIQLLKGSGYLSEVFLDQYRADWKQLETKWQKEIYEDGPPTGADYDWFFCAQDWEIQFWTKAPVTITIEGSTAYAEMKGKEGDFPKSHHFELVEENDKWLLSKIECTPE